jgi:hypothetical protein
MPKHKQVCLETFDSSTFLLDVNLLAVDNVDAIGRMIHTASQEVIGGIRSSQNCDRLSQFYLGDIL